jgi:rSAM/selenodomain-associated transferase 1
MSSSNALIIFTKAPIPGRVKTRIQPHLSAEGCANLHASFIVETIRLAGRVDGADIFLSCHPDTRHPFLQRVSGEYEVKLTPQKGGGLGERMDNAIKESLSMGYGKVIIIGSDSPDLPPAFIEEGFERLDSSEMVVGPSLDGGYYLIGGRRDIPVFDGIEWSTVRVFEQTIAKAKERGITCSILDEWYDIDTWEDLKAFEERRSRSLGR